MEEADLRDREEMLRRSDRGSIVDGPWMYGGGPYMLLGVSEGRRILIFRGGSKADRTVLWNNRVFLIFGPFYSVLTLVSLHFNCCILFYFLFLFLFFCILLY